MIGAGLEKELALINKSVPVGRKTLLEHMESGNGDYRTRDGCTCTIPQEEIDFLASHCSELEKMTLRLPILIGTDTSGDVSAWAVEGRAESAAVARILGKPRFTDDRVRCYNPDLKKLTKLLPNATFVVFLP